MMSQQQIPEQSPASDAESQSLAELFHLVKSLLPTDQKVVMAPPEMRVADAIRLMREHHYSQLPIVAETAVLGVFSFRSLAVGMLEMESSQHIGDLPVDEFLEELAFVHPSDSWESLFDFLDRDDSVLVGNWDQLGGILTPMDVLDYLHSIASPFVLLAEIELALRRIISACVSDEEWEECIGNCLGKRYPADKMPPDLINVTFHDYVQIIGNKQNWALFAVAFGPDSGQRNRTIVRLTEVGKFRNDVFHFRRRLLEQDQKLLASHRTWLQMKVRAFEAKQYQLAVVLGGSEEPTAEDYRLLLTRIPVARGQQQLYKALYDAGDQGMTQDELVEIMGRRDRYNLAGVLGALGRRVNGTPGYGQDVKPAMGMVLKWERTIDGQWRYWLQLGMRQALEELNPSWLHVMTSQQMLY